MVIASFNVNGIRSRLQILTDWLAATGPDVVCLQETKVQDHDFPRDALVAAGYQVAFAGQKSYNGVAILSREPAEDVRAGFSDGAFAEEARIITARIHGIRVVNTYVPQGQAVGSEKFVRKLLWMERLGAELDGFGAPAEPILWLGDLNVARDSRDVFDPQEFAGEVGFHPDEQAALEALLARGFTDVFREHVPDGGHYTFWDYRIPNGFKRNMGWRIDYIMACGGLAGKCAEAWIDAEPRRLEKPSDHTPVCARFEL